MSIFRSKMKSGWSKGSASNNRRFRVQDIMAVYQDTPHDAIGLVPRSGRVSAMKGGGFAYSAGAVDLFASAPNTCGEETPTTATPSPSERLGTSISRRNNEVTPTRE
jgi:hypothetical protein